MTSDTKQLVITVDKDVPYPGKNTGKRVTTMHTLYHDKLKNLAVGDSFFFADKTREDIIPLLRYAKRIGVQNLSALDTDEDEIFMVPGVRVWRLNEDTNVIRIADPSPLPTYPYKELSISSGVSYWRNVSTGEMKKVADGDKAMVEHGSNWELVNEKTWIEYQSSDL